MITCEIRMPWDLPVPAPVGLRFLISQSSAPGGAGVTPGTPTRNHLLLVYFYHLGSLKDYLTSFFLLSKSQIRRNEFSLHLSESMVFFSGSWRPRNVHWGFFPGSWPHTACARVVSAVTGHLSDLHTRVLLGPAWGFSAESSTPSTLRSRSGPLALASPERRMRSSRFLRPCLSLKARVWRK